MNNLSSKEKVLLSHNKKEKKFVKELGKNLLANGINVFFDKWDIQGGDSIPGELESAVETCNLFLYVLSPSSVRSKWVEEEYHAFLYRKINETNLRIIPILREDCEAPPFIAHLKHIDFRDFDYSVPQNFMVDKEGPFKELMESIFRKKSKPALGSIHPALASYEFYFQPLKGNPTNEDGTLNYEIGLKNITDSPLLNFRFTIHFRQPVISVEYDSNRSSANMTGGRGLSEDGMEFNWLGNQIMENGGWAVFIIKTNTQPAIAKLSTNLVGRVQGSNNIVEPDPNSI